MADVKLSSDSFIGRGTFIVFEGCDKAGKSTQAGLLAANLGTTAISFPNRTTPIGKVIAEHLKGNIFIQPRALQLAFACNRWECADSIKTILRRGDHVICDRYIYSGIAYAIANGVRARDAQASDVGLPQPDLVFYLKVDPATATQRAGYGEERFENVAFQTNVARAFDRMSGQQNWYALEAGGTKEEIASDILTIARDAIGKCASKPISTFESCI